MNVLGLMSGSSLDGLDLALCEFNTHPENGKINFQLLEHKSVNLSDKWVKSLSESALLSARDLLELDIQFGKYLGEVCADFIKSSGCNLDFIASHGHTVFHYPKRGFTLQIGHGAAIAEISGKETVSDFRSSDIVLGGTGAPFAPLVDYHLFPDIPICVNLGGISNMSIKASNKIFAFDISPCNQILNHLSGKLGKKYDDKGKLASQGNLDESLYHKLISKNKFNGNWGPRAIDNTWVKEQFFPFFASYSKVENALFTTCTFIIAELKKAIERRVDEIEGTDVLFSGGGVYNDFLMEKFKTELGKIGLNVLIPDRIIVEYKEAILMALMGYLRVNKKSNVIKGVTGAFKDAIGGCIYVPSLNR